MSTRLVLKKWKTVMIGWPNNLIQKHADRLLVPREANSHLLVKSLRVMKEIESLAVDDSISHSFKQFIRNRASNWKHLRVKKLPHGPGVEYEKLTSLRCKLLDAASVTVCPQLQRLEAKTGLPHRPPPGTRDYTPSLLTLVSSVLDLKDLRCLNISFSCLMDTVNEPLVLRLISSLKNLTSFQMSTGVLVGFLGGVDPAIQQLVQHNPDLKVLRLSHLKLGNESIMHLSQLRHLEILTLGLRDRCLSVDVLLPLFEGHSMHLKVVRINVDAFIDPQNLTPLKSNPFYESLLADYDIKEMIDPENPVEISSHLNATRKSTA